MEDLRSEFLALNGVPLSLGNDSDEVLSQHKRHSFSVDAKLLFPVVQKMSEVNVEYLEESLMIR